MMSMLHHREQSLPRERQSFADKLSTKLQRALSIDSQNYDHLASTAASVEQQDRSRSRGREVKSSGRGGAGNIRPSAQVDEGSYITSVRVGGREAVSPSPLNVRSTGRGGAGNFRSPSREAAPRDPSEDELILRSIDAGKNGVHSSGRGGVGNIHGKASPSPVRTSDASRSRSRARGLHSTGRGGAGNLMAGDAPYTNEAAIEEEEAEKRAELEDERERAEAARGRTGLHSTGRGGVANLTSLPAPSNEQPVLRHTPGGAESTGRGGSGNILTSFTRGRAKEVAQEDGRTVDGSRSRERESSVEGLWNRIKHPLSPRGGRGEPTGPIPE